ncbi:MAG: hypothetical protein ACREBB_00280 [Nitrosotalea sp.]
MRRWQQNVENNISQSGMTKNVCSICGAEIELKDNSLRCSVCQDEYYDKLKTSYNQNIERLNNFSRDLFRFYFDLTDESIKAGYKIIRQYLEIQRKLGSFNPDWDYHSMLIQYFTSQYFGKSIQDAGTVYSSLTNVCKANLSTISDGTSIIMNNMNMSCQLNQGIFGIKEKQLLSDNDKDMVKTITEVNKTYDSYGKDQRKDKINSVKKTPST